MGLLKARRKLTLPSRSEKSRLSDSVAKVRMIQLETVLLSPMLMRPCVALSSAVDLSCLEICSRTATARETWSIILKVRSFAALYSPLHSLLDSGREITVQWACYTLAA